MRLLVVSLLLMTTAFAGCFGDDSDGGDGDGGSGDGPEADMTVTPGTEAAGGTEFTFDGTASKGAKGFFWNFGDGTTGEGSVVKHTFPGANGRFPVTLVVTDSKGNRGLDLQIVKVGSGANTAPTATLSASALWIGQGDSITFTATANDSDEDPLSYYWTIGPVGAASSGGGAHDHGAATDDNASGEHADHGAAAGGPCAEGKPECMSEGESFSATLEEPGIYVYHCHPHPWMKQLLIVEPGGPTDAASYDIDNFGFSEPVARVGVGTNVTWTNVDPVDHTATLEAMHTGTPLPDTTNTVTWTPTEMGDFMVMVMVRDNKPYTDGDDFAVGEAMPMVNVRVSDVAPESEQTFDHAGMYKTNIATLDPVQVYAHHFNFTTNMTATLAWTSPAQDQVEMALDIFSGTTATGNPFDSHVRTVSPLITVTDLPAGDYAFRVRMVNGVSSTWTLEIKAVYDVVPPSSSDPHAGH